MLFAMIIFFQKQLETTDILDKAQSYHMQVICVKVRL